MGRRSKLGSLTIQSSTFATFWAAALGYELAPVPAGFATWNDFYRELGVPEGELVDGADRISDLEGQGPSIWFHLVPDAKTVKNRLHMDLAPQLDDDQAAMVESLIAVGAQRVDVGQDVDVATFVVLADPEGNEFCVLSPRAE